MVGSIRNAGKFESLDLEISSNEEMRMKQLQRLGRTNDQLQKKSVVERFQLNERYAKARRLSQGNGNGRNRRRQRQNQNNKPRRQREDRRQFQKKKSFSQGQKKKFSRVQV